jgi:hypothetical protein
MAPTVYNKNNKMQAKINNALYIFGGHPPEKGLCADALSYNAFCRDLKYRRPPALRWLFFTGFSE